MLNSIDYICIIYVLVRFALSDLSGCKSGKIGLRWRTKDEVIAGKGQLMCGSILCSSKIDLHGYEIPFQYVESNETKLELVKVRLCSSCSPSLYSYHTNKQIAEAAKSSSQDARKRKKQKVKKLGSSDDSVGKDEVEVIENPYKKEALVLELTSDEDT